MNNTRRRVIHMSNNFHIIPNLLSSLYLGCNRASELSAGHVRDGDGLTCCLPEEAIKKSFSRGRRGRGGGKTTPAYEEQIMIAFFVCSTEKRCHFLFPKVLMTTVIWQRVHLPTCAYRCGRCWMAHYSARLLRSDRAINFFTDGDAEIVVDTRI